MDWIYLSPHLDDIALSCGGLVWEQANSGEHPQIWSICAGNPPKEPLSAFAESLHQRWGTGIDSTEKRRSEDLLSCTRLLAAYRHFSIPDCIYRRSPKDALPLYASEEAIFGLINPDELPLVEKICRFIEQLLPEGTKLVSPLTVGGHVDHRLVRAAAEKLGMPLWYYADYPYVERSGVEISVSVPSRYEKILFPVSQQGLQAWFDSVAAHRSQISTFWPDIRSMEAALNGYFSKHGGIPLWRPINSTD